MKHGNIAYGDQIVSSALIYDYCTVLWKKFFPAARQSQLVMGQLYVMSRSSREECLWKRRNVNSFYTMISFLCFDFLHSDINRIIALISSMIEMVYPFDYNISWKFSEFSLIEMRISLVLQNRFIQWWFKTWFCWREKTFDNDWSDWQHKRW